MAKDCAQFDAVTVTPLLAAKTCLRYNAAANKYRIQQFIKGIPVKIMFMQALCLALASSICLAQPGESAAPVKRLFVLVNSLMC